MRFPMPNNYYSAFKRDDELFDNKYFQIIVCCPSNFHYAPGAIYEPIIVTSHAKVEIQ